jgi:predicted transposase YbfD/YdcC
MQMVCIIKKMTTQGPGSSTNFETHFSTLKDPRRITKGNIKYPLNEVLFLLISAVVSGCTANTAIAEFGVLKIEWLRKYFPYTNGTPSHDVIGDLLSILDKKAFGNCFTNWVNAIASMVDSKVVALDGKTIRGVASNTRKYPIHIVTAFCVENRMSIAQQSVGDKSNEIVAIPKLLETLALKGCIVTIDAMGCQKKIATKIRERQADYILQVKANQPELQEQIKKVFNRNTQKITDIVDDCGHGRIEKRTCEVIDNLTFLDGKEQWKDLKTIIKITSYIEDKKTGEYTTSERHYISSLAADAKLISRSIRDHWAIKNNLHWNLDVIFKEDYQLRRNKNAPENFNMVAKIGLRLIEDEKSLKKTKPMKMLRAALSDSYREKNLKI